MAAEDWFLFDIDDDWMDSCQEEVQCRRCKKNDLAWGNDNGRYRLYERDGRLHKCVNTIIEKYKKVTKAQEPKVQEFQKIAPLQLDGEITAHWDNGYILLVQDSPWKEQQCMRLLPEQIFALKDFASKINNQTL